MGLIKMFHKCISFLVLFTSITYTHQLSTTVDINISSGSISLSNSVFTCNKLTCPSSTTECIVSRTTTDSLVNIHEISLCFDDSGRIILQQNGIVGNPNPQKAMNQSTMVTRYGVVDECTYCYIDGNKLIRPQTAERIEKDKEKELRSKARDQRKKAEKERRTMHQHEKIIERQKKAFRKHHKKKIYSSSTSSVDIKSRSSSSASNKKSGSKSSVLLSLEGNIEVKSKSTSTKSSNSLIKRPEHPRRPRRPHRPHTIRRPRKPQRPQRTPKRPQKPKRPRRPKSPKIKIHDGTGSTSSSIHTRMQKVHANLHAEHERLEGKHNTVQVHRQSASVSITPSSSN